MARDFDPFAAAARDYHAHGYLPIPLPFRHKHPPPNGTPNSINITRAQIKQWIRSGKYNIGSVVPDGVVVIDVDGDKPGAKANFRKLLRENGRLPRTWKVNRGNPDRFHSWFQVPEKDIVWPGQLCKGVDVIYRHYRYVVLPPSVHPEGSKYRWVRPDGTKADFGEFPSLNELAVAPDWLIEFAQQKAYVVRERAEVNTRLWLKQFGAGEPCPEMRRVLTRHQKLVRQHADPGGLHDAMTDAVWAVCAEISHGHAGGRVTLRRLRKTFLAMAEASGRRSEDEARREWSRACMGAIEKTAVESVREGDPCTIEAGEEIEPDDFFVPGKGLKAMTLRKSIESSGKLVLDHTGEIYRYAETGVWTPEGEKEINRRAIRLLDERFRPEHARVVEFMVRAQEPRFNDDNIDTAYLNLPNGLLDWRTGTLHKHDPNVNSLIRIPTEWNPKADCPRIKKWLGEVFPDDALEFALEVIGYCLYYDNPLHKAILLYGTGRNGKSTFLRLIQQLIGAKNVTSRSPQDLDASQFQAISLYGKLANLAGDVDPHVFKSTEKFKKLTGGDTFTAERKFHGKHYEFRCRAKTIAAFNQLPRTKDTTEGFFSKWIVVPFTKRFIPGIQKPIPDLILRLTSDGELQGLLVESVKALQRLMARGSFKIPVSVARATEEFRLLADPVHAFIADRVVLEIKGFTPRQKLYDAYTRWCIHNNHHPYSARQFYERVSAATPGVAIVVRRGTRGYRNLKLVDEK